MERDTGTHHVDKEIVEMIVLSNYYQTPEGIGVGSTIDQFREIYPDMTAWFDKPHGAYYIETESHVGVQFIISDKDIKRKINGGADHQEINASYFKTGASISRIRVH